MIETTLRLRYDEQMLRPTAAWYLSGADPAGWLDEIAAWDVLHAALRLLPVPRSPGDRSPVGVVVTAAGLPAKTSHGVPFGCIAGRLYLPVDARLEPDVTDAELRSLLSGDYTYVWHPICGLVAFEEKDVLGVSDLLEPGPCRQSRLDRAVPGVAFAHKLLAIVPEEPITPDDVLAQGQEDIGTSADQIEELPPSPREPKKSLGRGAGRRAGRLVAGIVKWFTQRAPGGASEPTWINRLEDWANRRLQQYRDSLDAARNKEIARLLHKLETDPDEGLRYALPFGGDPHRGLAPPGDKLAPRPTDFNLSRLGGGPADFWDLSQDYQRRLMARYRELADREMRLGRHRRAAYIFAELLRDFAGAAGALVAGRHWREAAVLYRERLNRPLEAARCLEQGGLWTEAAALYEEIGEFERAGDVYRQLDQPDPAAELYRRAVEKQRFAGDHLGAARLLDEKLGDPQAAVGELAAAWPDSPQAGSCLRGAFRTLARLGRHSDTSGWIDELAGEEASAGTSATLIDVLADTARDYPDASVQHKAADSTRVLAASRLATATGSEARHLVGAVTRLVPEDRLLQRDGRRFLQRPPQRPVAPSAPPPVRVPRRGTPTLLHRFRLRPDDAEWQAAAPWGRSFFVAGYRGPHLVLVRGNAEGIDECVPVQWRLEPRVVGSPIVLATAPQGDGRVLVHPLGGPLLAERRLPATDAVPQLVTAGAVPGMSEGVMAAARTGGGITWLVESHGDQWPTLRTLGPQGEPLSTTMLDLEDYADEPADLALPVPLHARSKRTFVGLATSMLVINQRWSVDTIGLPHPIRSFSGSAPHTRTRVAAGFDFGGEIFWFDFNGMERQPFAEDMPSPKTCINRGGNLIAAGGTTCEVYSTHGRRAKLEAQLRDLAPGVVAALPLHRVDRFALVWADGHVAVYEVP